MPKYLKITFSVLLAMYLVVAFVVTSDEADAGVCTGMKIDVLPDGAATPFVTAAELSRELDSLPEKARGMELSVIDTQRLRRHLLDMDKIEDVSVVRWTDGSIHVTATPIVPVARVFDSTGKSYYINRQGKRVAASARYRRDVPIIKGDFDYADSTFSAVDVLPVVERIYSDSLWSGYISMIEVKGPSDILLIPKIREHVVNIGSPAALDDKLHRLERFYSEVLRQQGWSKYDTLSVKWDGQLVATRRRHKSAPLPVSQWDEDEAVSIDAMLAGDSIAPGQSLPGMKANSEIPVPKRRY